MNNTGARIKGKETKQLKQREHVLQCKYVISLHVDATQMKKYNKLQNNNDMCNLRTWFNKKSSENRLRCPAKVQHSGLLWQLHCSFRGDWAQINHSTS